MSESILGLVDRRGRADLIIFVVLAVGTLVVIWLLVSVVRPWLWG